jgi:hypothetical protein
MKMSLLVQSKCFWLMKLWSQEVDYCPFIIVEYTDTHYNLRFRDRILDES